MAQRYFVYFGDHLFAVVHAEDENEAVEKAIWKTKVEYDPKECRAVPIQNGIN